MVRGVSTQTGKTVVIDYCINNILLDDSILDVGFGRGIIGNLLRQQGYSNVDGVDVYGGEIEPYMIEPYREIHICDIRDFKFDFYNLIILGDVLEHLTLKDSQKLLKQFINNNHCDHILVSIPYMYSQKPTVENPHEEHKQPTITREYMEMNFPYLESIFEAEMEDISGYIISIWKWSKT